MAALEQVADRRTYTVTEAARLLSVSRSTVWRWIESGRLRAYRVGPKTIRIREKDLDEVVIPAKAEGPSPSQE
jgi:excisionase family DNA binding protein